ncbi:MAG: pyridoxal-phosphate dependent enzyme [Acidobacteria bacterium]|nr:pyridoxal-phosphate dependent enzyme [Acidobacteriota bacterium]
MTARELSITADDVHRAAEQLRGRIHRTPVLRSRLLDQLSGRQLFFKCENFQRGGSFKIRGATNTIRSLSEDERRRGVVAFSSGNHAQAVAIASRAEGVDAVIAMPGDAPRSKVEATIAYGATIVRYDRMTEDREAVASSYVEREGRTLVPPYDDVRIMAGQGTAALELIEEVGSLDAIVVPVGGGGLLAGTSTAAEGRALVYGAEPENACDTRLSLAAGERVTIPPPDTIADGARPQCPGRLTFPVIQERVAGVLTASEDEIVEAMRMVLTRMKMVVEPTGALGIAVAMGAGLPSELKRIGIVVSGGNVDMDVLAMLLGQGG